MSEKKALKSIFLLFVLIISVWLCLEIRQGFCLAFVLAGLQGPESQDLITQDSLWLEDSFILAGETWNILGISCSVSSWEEFEWHHHTQVSSRCPLWSLFLASLCRWLRTKGWVRQFRVCSCFSSAVTNNDCKNLKANMQWKKLFLGALFQDQR